MAAVVNTIKIGGPAEAVFDLVTTARFWPEWHPATRAVGGLTRMAVPEALTRFPQSILGLLPGLG